MDVKYQNNNWQPHGLSMKEIPTTNPLLFFPSTGNLAGVFRRVRRWSARGLRQLEHQQRHLHAHPRGLNQVRKAFSLTFVMQ